MADCLTCDSVRVMHVCVLSTFSLAALVFVAFRLCARRIQMIKLELNDYLCIVGLVWSFKFKYQTNADRTLALYLGVNSLHNAKFGQSRQNLGKQSTARGTASLGHICDFHPGVCPESLHPNFPDAVISDHLLCSSRL